MPETPSAVTDPSESSERESPSLELPSTDAPEAAPVLTNAPAAVETVAESAALEMVELDPAQAKKLEEMVNSYVEQVATVDTRGTSFSARASDIANLGSEDIRATARVSNRLLEKPLGSTKGATSGVTRSLLELRKTIERLDPQRQGNLRGRKLLGIIPVGEPMADYFRKYQSSQSHINAVIVSLYDGQEELRRDNVDIDQEKANLWASMTRLRQYAFMAERLDDALSAQIAKLETTNPERARVLKNDLLFPVRQKRTDLLTQLAVSVQGYLALDLIKRNNVELVKGVDRATTTTVSALRTAVIVAQALANQKLVLDQITALNETTGSLIESTSEMLKEQTSQVSQQAYEATVGIDKLEKAFANVYATMDEIDEFKIRSLDTMSRTITALESQVQRSRSYIDRARAEEARSQEGSRPELTGSAPQLPES